MEDPRKRPEFHIPKPTLVDGAGAPIPAKEPVFVPSEMWMKNDSDPTEHAYVVPGTALMLQVKQMDRPQPNIVLIVNLAEQKAIAQPFPNIRQAYEFAEFIANTLRYQPGPAPAAAEPAPESE